MAHDALIRYSGLTVTMKRGICPVGTVMSLVESDAKNMESFQQGHSTDTHHQNSFLTLTVKQTSLHSQSLTYPFCIYYYHSTTMREIDSNSAAIVMELWDTARYEGDNFYANFGQVTLDR